VLCAIIVATRCNKVSRLPPRGKVTPPVVAPLQQVKRSAPTHAVMHAGNSLNVTMQ